MSRLTDERLDELLCSYHQIEPPEIPVFTPSAVKKPRILAFPGRWVTAASIVLVILLGITAYFLFGNKNPIPVAPTSNVDSAQPTTESPSSSTVSAETESHTDSTLPQGIKREAATQLSTDSHGRAIITPVPDPTVTHNPGSADPTTPPKADASASTPTEAVRTPRELSPKNAIITPITPTQPKAAPTSPPATEPLPTPAQDEEKQTAVIRVPARSIEIISSESDTESVLYCCVYDSHGNVIGTGDLYDASHLVTVPKPSGSGDQTEEDQEFRYTFEYLPSQVSGTLRYEFYIKANKERYIVYTGTMNI